jgi:hypothetical protein
MLGINSTDEVLKLRQMSNNRKHPIIQGWNEKKFGIMLDGMLLKIKQHPHVRSTLLSSDCKLGYSSPDMQYWGCHGENKFHELLELVKSRIVHVPSNTTDTKREIVPDTKREIVPDTKREIVPDTKREIVPDTKREIVPDNIIVEMCDERKIHEKYSATTEHTEKKHVDNTWLSQHIHNVEPAQERPKENDIVLSFDKETRSGIYIPLSELKKLTGSVPPQYIHDIAHVVNVLRKSKQVLYEDNSDEHSIMIEDVIKHIC